MHGPCGKKRKTSPCLKDGQCKRENDRRTSEVRGMKMNNQWVVPYNPYLLMRYNCHIKVEVCSGVKAIKYLYKYIYIYKGHNKCAIYIKSDNGEKVVDEIKTFQDARWVSPPEALWRIYEFNLTEMQLAVINLQLHLPSKQPANPREGERYYERLLLNHVVGQTSFENLLHFHCNPTDVRNLWDTYYDDFSEDFHRSHSNTMEA
ncbi:hypothetical protein H5410_045102 [Solanum commersonii]|uniref:Uncharacterized protein n=1 Tax=Solanum commersonii TaxID=4109 RepID=A0A9J5XBT3_SOLCO|nr:hypothetical protein H5410_045102 [Solanum commersonii]